MSIQDLGAIGELVAAIATIATLIYLATQVRQNTRALRSSTFQNISSEMGQNITPLSTNSDLADLMIRSNTDPGSLSPAERIRVQAMLVGTFRRMEAVYVQNQLGSLDDELMAGFELSVLSLLLTPFGADWWETAKLTFHASFRAHIDEKLKSGDLLSSHPSISVNPSAAGSTT